MVLRDRPELAELFERSTVFLDRALAHGSVLVHCQKGQKRSPTVVLAWLVTRGVGTPEAINLISRRYTSREFTALDPSRSWGERYRKERPLWIEVRRACNRSVTRAQRLNDWARHWQSLQKQWTLKHAKLLEAWNALYRARPAADEPAAKKPKAESKDGEKMGS